METMLVESLVEKTRCAYLKCMENPSSLEADIKESSKDLEALNIALKNAKTVSEKSKLANGICFISGYRTQMKLLRSPAKSNHRNPLRVKWEDLQSAFKNRVRTAVIINLKHIDPKAFMIDCERLFYRKTKNALEKGYSFKANVVFCGEFKTEKAGEEICERKYMNSQNVIIYRDTNIKKLFREQLQAPILRDLEEFQEKGSGWTICAIINLGVNINKFNPQTASS